MILISIAWLLLIISHNISFMIYTPIIFLTAAILTKFDFRSMGFYVLSFIQGIILSSFFLLPALYFNGLITFRDLVDKEAVMRGSYFKPLVFQLKTAIDKLIKNQSSYYDFTLGTALFLVILLFPLSFIIEKNKAKIRDSVFIYLAFIFLTFLSMPSSHFIWDKLFFSKYIVYPFRVLAPAVFLGSIIAGYLAFRRKKIGIVLIIISIIAGVPFTRPNIELLPYDDAYFMQKQTFTYAPGTLKNMANAEFLPKTADKEFILQTERKFLETGIVPAKFEFENMAFIRESSVLSEKIALTYESQAENKLTVNTFYFPNWEAKIDSAKTEVLSDGKGRIVVPVPKGVHNVELRFGYLQIEKTANLLSVIGLMLVGGETLWMIGKKRLRKN